MELTKPLSYFLGNSASLYKKMVTATPFYIPALVVRERAGADTIIGPALCASSPARQSKCLPGYSPRPK
jgi:hypothetical protein